MQLKDIFYPGAVIQDRYEVIQKLGAGGFAVVYKALDHQINREVAIKVMNLLNQEADAYIEEFLRRFEQEARLAAKVHHPNVLNIHDYGIWDEHRLPYMVMEYLQGHDMEEHLHEHGPMHPKDLFKHFISVLEALGFAHKEGIVHKDLKPANLFLRFPGERRESMCILDFGIAHIRSATQRFTKENALLGTPQYIAPEYATEQIVSPALDVYQMGLILVELLTARTVVTAEDALVAVFQHVNGNINIPQQLIDCPLGPILQTALSTDPKNRYQNGFEFADALNDINPNDVPFLNSPISSLVPLHSTISKSMVDPSVTGENEIPKQTGNALLSDEERVRIAEAQGLTSAPTMAQTVSPEQRQAMNTPSMAFSAATSAPGTSQSFDAIEVPEEVEPTSSNKGAIIAVVGLLVALAIAVPVGFVVMKKDPPPTKPKVTKPAWTPVAINLNTNPAGVEVFEGDTKLGVTPLDVTFKKGPNESRGLTLKMANYKDKAVTLSPSSEPKLNITLDPIPKPKVQDPKHNLAAAQESFKAKAYDAAVEHCIKAPDHEMESCKILLAQVYAKQKKLDAFCQLFDAPPSRKRKSLRRLYQKQCIKRTTKPTKIKPPVAKVTPKVEPKVEPKPKPKPKPKTPSFVIPP